VALQVRAQQSEWIRRIGVTRVSTAGLLDFCDVGDSDALNGGKADMGSGGAPRFRDSGANQHNTNGQALSVYFEDEPGRRFFAQER
jgi:hypothetical protein